MRAVELARVTVPDFGLPDSLPTLSRKEYEARLAALRMRMKESGLDFMVVYGDREHSANVAFLTGYDPRFEETLLIVAAEGKPMLLLGNEGVGYADISPLELDRRLYQSFSLLGQARDSSQSLAELFSDCGIGLHAHVGVAGWKFFDQRETPDPTHWLEAPSYIVDTLREMTGGAEYVTNATALFAHPEEGLRATNTVDQLAHFEFVASYCSQAVRNVVTQLRPGMTEFEAVELMRLNGLPLSCHVMMGTGPRARLGLMSPSDRVIATGDPLTTALGLQGSLVARAGFVAHGPEDLPAEARDYVDAVAKPYFAAVVAWWESIGIGACAGDISDMVSGHLRETGVGLALNPGHLLHLDEWLHSPFFSGSAYRLRSGMALQCDIIPTPPAPYAPSNVEDGLALADKALRDEFARKYPGAWQRINQRREFMEAVLGMRLRPEVLPFSNWPSVLTPFMLDASRAMRVAS